MSSRSRRRVVPAVVYLALAVVLVLAAAPAAQGQPFGSWSLFERSPAGWIEVPHHPALNPASQITIEGWVNVDGRTRRGARIAAASSERTGSSRGGLGAATVSCGPTFAAA